MGSRPKPHVGHAQQKVRVVRVADPDPMWVTFLSLQDCNGAEVFGLHYNEVRVVGVADLDPVWAMLRR